MTSLGPTTMRPGKMRMRRKRTRSWKGRERGGGSGGIAKKPSRIVTKLFSPRFTFCLDEISFRRDYNSCRIGVVVDVDVVRPTFMGTLRLCNFCNFGATLLGFGTVFSNIIVHGIRNFNKNRITLTP